MLSLALIGTILSAVLNYVKNNPNIPWLNEQDNVRIHALVALVSVIVGVVMAAQQPGGLTAVNWGHTINVIATDGLVVAAAAFAFYQWVLKAYDTATKREKLAATIAELTQEPSAK